MRKLTFLSTLFAAVLSFGLFSATANASVETGAKAPEFTATDSNGASHSLSDFAGKTVVLEWTNNQCPYVVKHYETGNMQKLQKHATEDGVVWLTVISSAPGKQGHVSAEEANTLTEERNASPTAVLLDESGEIGRLYDAKTTPHMFVIDEHGVVVYQGAIDDNDSARHSTVEGATNYVEAALNALKNGEEIEHGNTQPYGCSVKY
tara:strand:- start:2326 stop:2943 length:618 start_codon:yes stop_codon:yes gene_type:complete